MINLLPPDVKENILYARRNMHLRQWVITLIVCIVSILIVVGLGHIYLKQSVRSYTAQVEQGQQNLKTQKLEETHQRVQDLTASLKLVVQVLQRQILFSELLQQTGAALPSGSVLTNLSIDKVQGGLDLEAAASDYQTATQVQLNLQDPNNKIFEKADIINIQCSNEVSATATLAARYPCTVQIRALFAKNNSFSLLTPPPTPGANP